MNSAKRSRARQLTPEALRKLDNSIKEWELNENAGSKVPWEKLSEITGLDVKTVKKVLSNDGCDKRTLERFFTSFNLEFTDDDHVLAFQTSETQIDPSFVGRESAIAELDELVKRNKIIVIQAQGGVGKTTLAKRFLI